MFSMYVLMYNKYSAQYNAVSLYMFDVFVINILKRAGCF